MGAISSLYIRIKGDAKQFEAELSNVERSLRRSAAKLSSIGANLTRNVTLPIVGIGVGAGAAAMSFESAFTGVIKTVDATEAQIARLRKEILAMGREVPATHAAIAGVAQAAGQLGIQVPNIMSFTRTMIDMGSATNLAADEAATQMARFANIMQMPQTEFQRLGSSVVALGNNLATTEAEIVALGLRLAGAGRIVGMSESQIMGLAGALSQVGVEAEMGGTAVSRVLQRMANAVATGGEKLDAFAKTAGMSAGQFAAAFREDATSALIAFIDGLAKLKDAGGNVFAALGEADADAARIADVLLRAAGSGDKFRAAIELSNKAWIENNALTKEAERRYGTSESKLRRSINAILEVAIALGDSLLPVLTAVLDASRPLLKGIEGMARGFAGLPGPVQTVILSLVGLVAAVGPAVSAIAKLRLLKADLIVLLPKLSVLMLALEKSVIGVGVAYAASAVKAAAFWIAAGGTFAPVAVVGAAVYAIADAGVQIAKTGRLFNRVADDGSIADVGEQFNKLGASLRGLATAQAGVTGKGLFIGPRADELRAQAAAARDAAAMAERLADSWVAADQAFDSAVSKSTTNRAMRPVGFARVRDDAKDASAFLWEMNRDLNKVGETTGKVAEKVADDADKMRDSFIDLSEYGVRAVARGIAQLATGGIKNFKQFADAVKNELIEIAVQALIVDNLFKSLKNVGGLSGGGSSGGTGFGSGMYEPDFVGPTMGGIWGQSKAATPSGHGMSTGSGVSVVINNHGAPIEGEVSASVGTGPSGEKVVYLTVLGNIKKALRKGDLRDEMALYGAHRVGAM